MIDVLIGAGLVAAVCSLTLIGWTVLVCLLDGVRETAGDEEGGRAVRVPDLTVGGNGRRCEERGNGSVWLYDARRSGPRVRR